MMIGCQTSKIIDAVVLSKKCNICSTSNPPTQHKCPKNYDGSSKGMEAEGSLRLCKRAWERRYTIGIIVSDDDSTMRAILKHSHKDKKEKDNNEIERDNLADPLHISMDPDPDITSQRDSDPDAYKYVFDKPPKSIFARCETHPLGLFVRCCTAPAHWWGE